MQRTDNDSWNITESVGATALGVAAARAAETESSHPLIHDPFARSFLEAAGEGMWNLYLDASLHDQLEPDLKAQVRAMTDFMAVRTAFFDEFFMAAANDGVKQVVILAAGLDARAWRLPWPDGTTVYELDQPKVLDFKSATLRKQGAAPAARLVNVAVDLRQDWPKALQDTGFDAAQPSAWSAEGLLRYLPAQAQDLLFERINELSPAGSWLAANTPSREAIDPDRLTRQREQMQRLRATAARLTNSAMPDVEGLWYPEERTDVPDWLREHGWAVSSATMAEMLARYDRVVPDEDIAPPTVFVSAERSLSF
jgi:methyltransferase (TIGR00027 family)